MQMGELIAPPLGLLFFDDQARESLNVCGMKKQSDTDSLGCRQKSFFLEGFEDLRGCPKCLAKFADR